MNVCWNVWCFFQEVKWRKLCSSAELKSREHGAENRLLSAAATDLWPSLLPEQTGPEADFMFNKMIRWFCRSQQSRSETGLKGLWGGRRRRRSRRTGLGRTDLRTRILFFASSSSITLRTDLTGNIHCLCTYIEVFMVCNKYYLSTFD